MTSTIPSWGPPSANFRDIVRRASDSPRRPRDEERCDMCGETLFGEHRHVVDVRSNEFMCACQPCSLLFDRDAAGGGHFRLVRDRRVLVDADFDDPVWHRLGVPVGLAFFVPHGAGVDVQAVYPGPAGPTESTVEPGDWADLVSTQPDLADVEPDVEAVLVRRMRDVNECWVLPVDDCYRLVAVLRTHWQGFNGGDEVWDELAAFFDDLRAKARLGGG